MLKFVPAHTTSTFFLNVAASLTPHSLLTSKTFDLFVITLLPSTACTVDSIRQTKFMRRVSWYIYHLIEHNSREICVEGFNLKQAFVRSLVIASLGLGESMCEANWSAQNEYFHGACRVECSTQFLFLAPHARPKYSTPLSPKWEGQRPPFLLWCPHPEKTQP